MLNIQILGIGCARHKALKSNLEEALVQYPVAVNIQEISEVNEFIRFGIEGTPAMFINGKLVCENEIPSVDDIVSFLRKSSQKPLKENKRKIILVPTDFSDNSSNALIYAQYLAPFFHADIRVLHVHHPEFDPTNPVITSPAIDLRSTKEQLLRKFVVANKINGPDTAQQNIIVEESLTIGFPGQEILNFAEEDKPIMIIMGISGAGGVIDKLMGSVSAMVFQKAHCPVLLIPQTAEYKGINNMLYASNYVPKDQMVLDNVVKLADTFHAIVHIVHVSESEKNGYRKMASEIKSYISDNQLNDKLKFKTIIAESVSEGLLHYVDQNNIDLLVMLSRNRTFVQKFFQKSMTRKMTLVTKTPILVLHTGTS